MDTLPAVANFTSMPRILMATVNLTTQVAPLKKTIHLHHKHLVAARGSLTFCISWQIRWPPRS